MRVIVLGAGVVGVTTAYALAKRGCAVTVVDRSTEVASGASYANGGQLSYDFASPMGSPSVLRHMAAYLLGRDEAFKIRPSLDPAFVSWGLRFLANCLPSKAEKNAAQLAQLARASERSLTELVEETGLEFNRRKSGKLVLFDNVDDFTRAKMRVSRAAQSGRELTVLTSDECCTLEPALEHWGGGPIAGGLLAPNDEVGDARLFSKKLAKITKEKFKLNYILGTEVNAVHTRRGKACAIELAGDRLEADAIAVCMGVDAVKILRPLKITASLQPIRGYSITAPATKNAPKIAITDLGRKMVYSRIGDDLRVAGFADAGPHADVFFRRRVSTLTGRAKETLGASADFSKIASTWIGVRPSTPDSLPIVRASKIPGLYLNIGHGMFGWTLSAICAEHLADEMTRRARS